MLKTKFFEEDNASKLEYEVNNFIKDKLVTNISYSVVQCGYDYIHCCCVLYNSLSQGGIYD